VLRESSCVNEVTVIGVSDPKWGEVGHAIISVNSSNSDDWEQIVSELKNLSSTHLAKFKHPQYFRLLNDLPKGDSGKILKKDLYKLI
jgi:fatty-acyl-CoA synthase